MASRAARAGRAQVYREHQSHLVGLPAVAGGGEPLAIEGHVLAELRQRGGRGARIDGQPRVADVGEALRAVHGHADGRMRTLHGPRDHRQLLDVVEGAPIAEALLRPGEADDLQRLVEARAVLGQRDPEAVELAGNGAPPHAELEPSPGEDVGDGRLLRAGEGMVERQEGDGGADADARRPRGDGGHGHQRIGQEREGAAEVQLGQPGHIEAQGVGEGNKVEHLAVAVRVRPPLGRRSLMEDPEAHGGDSRPGESAMVETVAMIEICL